MSFLSFCVVDHIYIVGIAVLEAEDESPAPGDHDGVDPLAIPGQPVYPPAMLGENRRPGAVIQPGGQAVDLGVQRGVVAALIPLGVPLDPAVAPRADGQRGILAHSSAPARLRSSQPQLCPVSILRTAGAETP